MERLVGRGLRHHPVHRRHAHLRAAGRDPHHRAELRPVRPPRRQPVQQRRLRVHRAAELQQPGRQSRPATSSPTASATPSATSPSNPGQAGVLVHNTAAFQSRYGTAAADPGRLRLNRPSVQQRGEHVRLQDPYGLTDRRLHLQPDLVPHHQGRRRVATGDRPGRRPRPQRPRQLAPQHRHRRRPRRPARRPRLPRRPVPRRPGFRHRRSTCNGRPAPTRRRGYLVFRGRATASSRKVATLPAGATDLQRQQWRRRPQPGNRLRIPDPSVQRRRLQQSPPT